MNQIQDNNMKFPVIVIKNSEAPLYYFTEATFGLVSKGGEIFYKGGVIYDSEGARFTINGFRSVKKAPLFTSIRYFQPMYLVGINAELSEKIGLEDFKEVVIKHIRLNKKYWEKRDLIEGLEADVLRKNSFEEVVSFLR